MRKIWMVALALALTQAWAQTAAPGGPSQPKAKGLLPESELSKILPESFFFHGQIAPTQKRNAAAVRTQDDRVWMVALVDTSGYSSGVAERVQGFLITETELTINGKPLAPGVYAFGSDSEQNFIVQDVGRKDVLVVPTRSDPELRRPRPLQIVPSAGAWHLYLGRKSVEIASR